MFQYSLLTTHTDVARVVNSQTKQVHRMIAAAAAVTTINTFSLTALLIESYLSGLQDQITGRILKLLQHNSVQSTCSSWHSTINVKALNKLN